jgi:hypothetical protein
MTFSYLALVLFGIAPAVLLLLLRALGYDPSVWKRRKRQYPNFEQPVPPAHIARWVPWDFLDASTIERLHRTGIGPLHGFSEPEFKTLRLDASKTKDQGWQFRIRFAFINRLRETVVIDDIHAKLYEQNVPGSAVLTMGSWGEIILLQDNTILREQREYSIEPGDGYEISLVFKMSSVGYAYTTRTVFGLLLDYYAITKSGVGRRARPSDCLYMFQQKPAEDWSEFRELNLDTISELALRHRLDGGALKAIERLKGFLDEHAKLRLTPNP